MLGDVHSIEYCAINAFKLAELKLLYICVLAIVNYELMIGHGLKDVCQMRFDFTRLFPMHVIFSMYAKSSILLSI